MVASNGGRSEEEHSSGGGLQRDRSPSQ